MIGFLCVFLIKVKKDLIGLIKNKNSIEFLNMTTNQAIQYYKNLYPVYNVAVLNFAHPDNVGGGVDVGNTSQEAELCRTSPYLYESLLSAKYNNLYNDWKCNNNENWDNQILYTPNAYFIREASGYSEYSDNKYNILPKRQRYASSVITAVAPNLSDKTSLLDIPDHNRYTNWIKNIYCAPLVASSIPDKLKWNNENNIIKPPHINILILGAIGTGSFSFPDQDTDKDKYFGFEYAKFVAQAFVNALAQEGGHYDIISFAIPEEDNNDYNFNIFYEVFAIAQAKYNYFKKLDVYVL